MTNTILVILAVSILILAFLQEYKVRVKWFKVTNLWTIVKQPKYTVIWVGHLAITVWKE